jgi:hypothetical protein
MFEGVKHSINAMVGKPTVALKHNVLIEHIRDGKIIDTRSIRNLVVNAGKAQVAGLINGATSGAFTYIAVGTGTTIPSATDTALQAEIIDSGLARASATCTRITTSVTNDTAQLVVTFNVTGTKAVTESGVFNQSTGGTMLCRQTFSAINVQSGDSLSITWKIQVS